MEGRAEAERLLEPQAPLELAAEPPQPQEADDPRKVAVMHGRDEKARNWLYDWLRRIGLKPLEWSQLISGTEKATPYSGEAVAAAFATAQAVVVLFTPDEIGALHPDLIVGDGTGEDEAAAPQPRLNVILEAGMSLQSHQDQTVLVELGPTRPISDLTGRNTVRLTGSASGLNDLANRLEKAGCPVDRSGNDWLETEELERLPALRRTADGVNRTAAGPGGVAAFGREGAFYSAFRARGIQIQYRNRGDEGWGAWREIGPLEEEPVGLAASSIGDSHVEVFALLPSGEVLRNRRWEGKWQSRFFSLGSPFGEGEAIRISAGSKGEGHEEVFVESADGEIAHIWWDGDWNQNDDPATRLGDGWWRF